jgi:phosphoribosylaminoimidazole-succinocarboxamide synthase
VITSKDFSGDLAPYAAQLAGRAMLVRRTEPLPIECVVRGYISGSGWKDYQKTGAICGIALPAGLRESDRLPEPIFTPSTKATSGHDENISFEETAAVIGRPLAERLRDVSLAIYKRGVEHAATRGIILADTKFEFGMLGNDLIWIDEALTPDSSRFWPADQYSPGKAQPSFDKQYVRDYLEEIGWNKKPPAPALPPPVVTATQGKYREAYQRVTGHALD